LAATGFASFEDFSGFFAVSFSLFFASDPVEPPSEEEDLESEDPAESDFEEPSELELELSAAAAVSR